MGSKGDEAVAELRAWDKTFAYLPAKGRPFSLSCKLPYTGYEALQLPYAEPTGYGLGKSGWVSFNPGEDSIPDIEQLKAWVEESYRAQAPRKLVNELDARA